MTNAEMKTVLKAVEESMASTCNFYAQKNDMKAATAVHDAFLCVEQKLKSLVDNT